jgi:hypothetical protein
MFVRHIVNKLGENALHYKYQHHSWSNFDLFNNALILASTSEIRG